MIKHEDDVQRFILMLEKRSMLVLCRRGVDDTTDTTSKVRRMLQLANVSMKNRLVICPHDVFRFLNIDRDLCLSYGLGPE